VRKLTNASSCSLRNFSPLAHDPAQRSLTGKRGLKSLPQRTISPLLITASTCSSARISDSGSDRTATRSPHAPRLSDPIKRPAWEAPRYYTKEWAYTSEVLQLAPPPVIAPKATGKDAAKGSMEKPKANASADMAL